MKFGRNKQQVAKRSQQREHGNSLRAWLQDRQAAAMKRRAEAAKTSETGAPVSRGVDRVPARLKVTAPAPQWIRKHEPLQHPDHGRWVKGLPYTNPARDEKSSRSGRLRKDLR